MRFCIDLVYIQDAKELVQLMLFATFASPEQLGYDSTLDSLSTTSTQTRLPISELAELILKGPLHPTGAIPPLKTSHTSYKHSTCGCDSAISDGLVGVKSRIHNATEASKY